MNNRQDETRCSKDEASNTVSTNSSEKIGVHAASLQTSVPRTNYIVENYIFGGRSIITDVPDEIGIITTRPNP